MIKKNFKLGWFILLGIFCGIFGGLVSLYAFSKFKNLGSLAEWFGAAGTIAAVGLSLYLSIKKEKISVDLYSVVSKQDIPGVDRDRGNYKYASIVHAINPDPINHVLTLESIELHVNGKQFKEFYINVFNDKTIVNTKKYLLSSGKDVELFTFDWSNIYQNFKNHKKDSIWSSLKESFDDRVMVVANFKETNGAKFSMSIHPPMLANPEITITSQ